MDNRIKLPVTKIDFNNVGLTGQDHDNYPPAQGQARFDHMRLYLIGLLSQQSSHDEPTQKRDGTAWFDLYHLALKVYYNGSWHPYSDAISIQTDIGSVTLTEWSESVSNSILGIQPDVVFFGECTASGVDQIPIPPVLQPQIFNNSRIFITVTSPTGDTSVVDPREVQLVGAPTPTTIVMTNNELDNQDRFTVVIRRIPDSSFYTTTVSVP